MALTLNTPIKLTTRNHFIIILLSIVVLGFGYYFSMINLLGKEWLSRSGSLVVVLGIVSGFSGIIQERLLVSRLEIRKRIELLQRRKKLRLLKVEKDFVDKEVENIEKKFADQTKELLHSIKFSVGLIEGALLIFGTVVWGFGDIVFSLLA